MSNRNEFSPATQRLIERMMKEKKIPLRKQKEISKAIKIGTALPVKTQPIVMEEIPNKIFTMKTRSVAQRETQDQIRDRGGYSRDLYHGGPIVNGEDKKEKLQNKMAFGMEDPVKAYRAQLKAKPIVKPVDRFIELEKEVNEREGFLAEMESLGQGPKYRSQIHTQISGIIREMEHIDLERNTILQARLDKLNNDNKGPV